MNQSRSSPAGDLAQIGRGLLMGGADIIPGVSGGTIALILGIYERLVTAISRFDLTLLGHLRRREWARAAAHVDLRFLVALGCGILAGIGGLAKLMNYLLTHHPVLTLSAFFGLILASSLLVARSIHRWNISQAVLAVAGGGFAFWLVGQSSMQGAESYGYVFFCGMVAICAMILPGISGAFILLIMGKYVYISGVISKLIDGEVTAERVLTLAVFACGCALGLLTFSKFLRWLLANYKTQTMAVLCGFMIGSLRRIWPYKEQGDPQLEVLGNVWPESIDAQAVLAIILAAVALASVFMLDWLSGRDAPKGATG